MRLMLCAWLERGRTSEVDELGVDEPSGIGGQEKVTAADWMVIPLARSAGRKSVTVEPSSTSCVDQYKGNKTRARERSIMQYAYRLVFV